MKFGKFLFFVAAVFVVLFVVYLAYGGIVKLNPILENQSFTYATGNCSNQINNYSCYTEFYKFLNKTEVDNSPMIYLYSSEKKFNSPINFGAVVDSRNIAAMGKGNFTLTKVSSNYYVVNLPYKSRLSPLIYDYRLNNYLKKNYVKKGNSPVQIYKIYDAYNSQFTYLVSE